MQYHWVGENNAPDTKNHKESLPPVGCVVSDNNTFLQYCAPELLHKIVLFQDIIADGLGKEVSISRHLIIAANNRVLPVNMGSRKPPYGGLSGSGRLRVADRVGLLCFSADGQVVIPGHVVLGLFEEL
jgi:hypothetical protein